MTAFSRPQVSLSKFIAALAILSIGHCLLAADLYVAPAGNDANAGTRDHPVATIGAARDLVRARIGNKMNEDIIVHVDAGDYFVETPIVFDDRDSGRDGHNIIYQGAPDLATHIYGGRRVTGWKMQENGEAAAEVRDLQEHFTLYENGIAANGGIFHVFEDAPAGNWRREKTQLIYHPRHLPVEQQVIVLGTTKDVLVIQGRSMQQVAENIVFDGLNLIGSDFAVEWKKGATDNVSWDGEYDGKPWGGRPLSAVAPDMRHGQFFIENARRIVIRNSRLYGAGFMAVMFNRWAQENRVENCWIENAGCNGLFFMGWECGRGPFKTVAESYVNKKNVIRNNVFLDIGRFADDAGGIYLVFSGDNIVEHNVFHGIRRYGVATKGWRPKLINAFYHYALLLDSQRNLKEEKEFDAPDIKLYDGYVVTEKNQGAELLHSRNNIIRFNDLSQIARDGSDMGMIEMWGAGTGNRWEYNACHDGIQNGGWDEWMHVLFNDDGSHQTMVRGNIIYWIAGGGRSRAIMCKGNEQTNISNIIADSALDSPATIGPFVEEAHDMVWSHNIIAADFKRLHEGGGGSETIEGVPHRILKESIDNVYYFQQRGVKETASATAASNIPQQLDEARQGGESEKGSVYADPMFDRKHPWWDSRYTDYRLRPESPALKLGFEQTDMDQIGLRKDFPFALSTVFDHPAEQIWKAANYVRIFGNHAGGVIQPHSGRALEPNSWVRYDNVNFGKGTASLFRARVEYDTPMQGFETTVKGKPFPALELGDSWCPIPYWEVSPIYMEASKKGPELMDVAFAPEKDPASVKWTSVTEPLLNHASQKSMLGVINFAVVNGEKPSNGAAYMRASLYAKQSGKSGIEIRGAYGMKVWLNGQQVFSQLGDIDKSPRVEVTFKQGWNEFLVKVVEDDKSGATDDKDVENFRASITMYYRTVNAAFIVPGAPGKEILIPPNSGAAIEVRLDAPDGKRIGELAFGQKTCSITKTEGIHDLFLVFPNQNVKILDWYRFEQQ